MFGGSDTILEVVAEALDSIEHPMLALAKGAKILLNYIKEHKK